MSEHLWQPSAELDSLRQRGELLRNIRNYFHQEDVMEVETPMLSHHATVDPHIDSFQTVFTPLGTKAQEKLYLHTSPEFPMKRLLSAGSGDIYFLGRVFRNGEAGGRHNPEFTMLEWYRLGIDHHALMDDVTGLLAAVTNFEEQARFSYRELFEEEFGIDPHTATDETLMKLTHEYVDSGLSGLARNDYLDLLFSTSIEPNLGDYVDGQIQGVFVYDYPASMSALSRIIVNEQGQKVAARFELFANGYELANGYHELADGHEQRARFEKDLQERELLGKPVYPYDQNMVSALEQGFPDCAGVAMGIDRLHMLIAQKRAIKDVIPFEFFRA
ncbi:EF-P lysine aminoacylase EpmA [Parendozoicomonas haliclonae]|uniref:Elongation factor P-(R)-beta-lysine ligase n=1 Tax=Parendozoicomonas haliclonae TaxID=1960125 RepID=A0A1X7APG3_9GAMM|nr:EF-P lysine aminoacylase EpmA [Parendozoicomonas haliclonae]SMA50145.1 Elongation factor P-(R)-beta-lysine ligase [Parendozoicomonas haliclonae]